MNQGSNFIVFSVTSPQALHSFKLDICLICVRVSIWWYTSRPHISWAISIDHLFARILFMHHFCLSYSFFCIRIAVDRISMRQPGDSSEFYENLIKLPLSHSNLAHWRDYGKWRNFNGASQRNRFSIQRSIGIVGLFPGKRNQQRNQNCFRSKSLQSEIECDQLNANKWQTKPTSIFKQNGLSSITLSIFITSIWGFSLFIITSNNQTYRCIWELYVHTMRKRMQCQRIRFRFCIGIVNIDGIKR